MYRDEILAIAEAVQEARKAGALEANQKSGPHIANLERAVRELLKFAKSVEQLQWTSFQPDSSIPDHVQYIHHCNDANIDVLNKFKLAAANSIRSSGVNAIRRNSFGDSDDIPF